MTDDLKEKLKKMILDMNDEQLRYTLGCALIRHAITTKVSFHRAMDNEDPDLSNYCVLTVLQPYVSVASKIYEILSDMALIAYKKGTDDDKGTSREDRVRP